MTTLPAVHPLAIHQVRHDLPRPPTVITHLLGDEIVEAYAGSGQGVQSIKASEWEPFIRTMPHSEFPSASACMCEVRARSRTLGGSRIGDGEDLVVDPNFVDETGNTFGMKGVETSTSGSVQSRPTIKEEADDSFPGEVIRTTPAGDMLI